MTIADLNERLSAALAEKARINAELATAEATAIDPNVSDEAAEAAEAGCVRLRLAKRRNVAALTELNDAISRWQRAERDRREEEAKALAVAAVEAADAAFLEGVKTHGAALAALAGAASDARRHARSVGGVRIQSMTQRIGLSARQDFKLTGHWPRRDGLAVSIFEDD